MTITIKLNVIGKEKSVARQSLLSEYMKRIHWDIKITEFVCKESGNSIHRMREESKLLFSNVAKTSKIIVLDEKGTEYNSKDFAKLLKNFIDNGFSDIIFLVGGAYGHSVETKNKADIVFSLSQLTFSHLLVRILLLEQIYRAYTIINNHPYHKE